MMLIIYKTYRKMRGDINSILTNNELSISIKKNNQLNIFNIRDNFTTDTTDVLLQTSMIEPCILEFYTPLFYSSFLLELLPKPLA